MADDVITIECKKNGWIVNGEYLFSYGDEEDELKGLYPAVTRVLNFILPLMDIDEKKVELKDEETEA